MSNAPTSSVAAGTEDENKAKGAAPRKKRVKRLITDIIIHVHASFNNTLTTVSDVKGNVLAWATAGGCGFRGSRKSTPFAGQIATSKAVLKVKETYGAESAEVRVCGPGPGRDASIRAVREHVSVTAIYDVTRIPFNGCRPPKERRV
jgi:small subunit ribosomal protein S11